MEVLRFVLFFWLLGAKLLQNRTQNRSPGRSRGSGGGMGQLGEAWGVAGGSRADLDSILNGSRIHFHIILGYLFVCLLNLVFLMILMIVGIFWGWLPP